MLEVMIAKQIDFIRDGRAPIPRSEKTSYTMSRIRGKNTKPEVKVRKELWERGLRGYRLHRKGLPGRPDLSYAKYRLAIFINGCFWHRCPHCSPSFPKTNRDFWKEKFERNTERDVRKRQELERLGWTVLTLWECQIDNNLSECIDSIQLHIEKESDE